MHDHRAANAAGGSGQPQVDSGGDAPRRQVPYVRMKPSGGGNTCCVSMTVVSLLN